MAKKDRLSYEARALLLDVFTDELADYHNLSFWVLYESEGIIPQLLAEVDKQENPERIYYEIFERTYDKIMHSREYGKISKIRRELKKIDKYELFFSLLSCIRRSKHLNCFFCYSQACPFG
jgi:hypothetical protein